jgi:serine protease Do
MLQVASMATAAAPSVVGLRGGTGVVIAAGRVLTLASRLRGGETEIVRGGAGTRATVLATDPDLDIALLEADTGDAPALEWSATTPGIGTPVLALGDPGGAGLRATAGAVSAAPLTLRGRRGRPLPGVIEHTAPLPRGSGGGPLLDADGRMLGINARRQDGGLILALPAAELRPRVDALLAGQAAPPRRLGVAVLSPRAARRMRSAVGLPERDGLLVRAVDDDGPAAAAGVQRGDLLVRANDAPLTAVDDLFDALDALPDDGLRLGVVRGTEELELVLPSLS